MDFKSKGEALRNEFKNLVLEYMSQKEDCSKYGVGMRQADIFRECGMDWGEKPNCTSSNQQYWIVAILRELEEENKIQRDDITKKWRIK